MLTCLSIGEDASVVPIERIVQNVPSQTFEDCLLGRKVGQPRLERVKAVVEGERLWLLPGTNKLKYYVFEFFMECVYRFNIQQSNVSCRYVMLHQRK